MTCSVYYAQDVTQHLVGGKKMKKPLYVVFDNVAKMYQFPIFSEPTDGVAIRTIQTAMEDPNSQFKKHAQDFTLVRLGNFDDEQGVINQDSKSDVIELSKLIGE